MNPNNVYELQILMFRHNFLSSLLVPIDNLFASVVFDRSLRFESFLFLFTSLENIFQEYMALIKRMEALKQELEAEKLKCSVQ